MAEQHKLLEIIEDEATTEATTEIWSGSESDNDVFSSSSSVRTINSQLKSSEIFFFIINTSKKNNFGNNWVGL